MMRLIVASILRIAANAIGLIVAAIVLDDMTLTASAFLLDVLIFTGVLILAQPLVVKIGIRHADALAGSSALIASLIALVVAAWLSDGLQITGTWTWVLATVIVWLASLLAGFLLPALFVKKAVTQSGRGSAGR